MPTLTLWDWDSIFWTKSQSLTLRCPILSTKSHSHSNAFVCKFPTEKPLFNLDIVNSTLVHQVSSCGFLYKFAKLTTFLMAVKLMTIHQQHQGYGYSLLNSLLYYTDYRLLRPATAVLNQPSITFLTLASSLLNTRFTMWSGHLFWSHLHLGTTCVWTCCCLLDVRLT